MRRFVLAIVALAALVMPLTGCTSTPPDSGPSDQSTAATTTAPITTTDTSVPPTTPQPGELYPQTAPYKAGVKQITQSNGGDTTKPGATFECDKTGYIPVPVPFLRTVQSENTTIGFSQEKYGDDLSTQLSATITITDGEGFQPVAAIVSSLDSNGSKIDQKVATIGPEDLAKGKLKLNSNDFGLATSYISEITLCTPGA